MKKHRAFLKWAGGKFALVDKIRPLLPSADTLIEPFVGAGSVFLNTDYANYRLSDINPDLINLYNLLKDKPDHYIADAKRFFTPEFNDKSAYVSLRNEFNHSQDIYLRSLYFLYMNRHGYNGLCRYNKKGIYNVPFGSHKKPYFPQAELEFFAEKASKATFVCESYQSSFKHAEQSAVIYCDPPYAPLSDTANFTSYASDGFGLDDQKLLSECAKKIVVEKHIPVLISNHDTPLTREYYQGADLSVVKVKRSISRNGAGRKTVDELLALFTESSFTGSLVCDHRN